MEIRAQMRLALKLDFALLEACDRLTALAVLRRDNPRLVLLDLGLPPAVGTATEGLVALREMLRVDPSVKVVVLTENSNKPSALAAVEYGAYDFLEKPVEIEILKLVLRRAAYLQQLEQECRRLSKQVQMHPWPGYVRELEKRIKRAVLMATGPLTRPQDLDLALEKNGSRMETLREAKARVERELVLRALALENGNISRAARSLGLSRQALHDFIKKYELKKRPSLSTGRDGESGFTGHFL